MTPLEFARRYWELEVPVEENGVTNWTRVRVASYRIGLEAGGTAKDAFLAKVRPHINEKHEEITVQVKTALGEIKTKTYRSRQELAQNVADPFYGKGSPEEVQVVLQLAVRFGLVKREGLEKYCKDDHIGLDCSGFVGNYIWHVLLGNSWDADPAKKSLEVGASSGIRRMLNKGPAINSLDELDWGGTYLFGLVNGAGNVIDSGNDPVGHIVITEPYTLAKRMHSRPAPARRRGTTNGTQSTAEEVSAIQVVESTGGKGLVESEYLFLGENRGVFTVFRGSKNKEMKVRIHRLQ